MTWQDNIFPKNSFTFLDFWNPKPPKTPKMLKYRGFGYCAHSSVRTVQLKSLSLHTEVVHNPVHGKITFSPKIVSHFSTSGTQNPKTPKPQNPMDMIIYLNHCNSSKIESFLEARTELQKGGEWVKLIILVVWLGERGGLLWVLKVINWLFSVFNLTFFVINLMRLPAGLTHLSTLVLSSVFC